MGSCFSSAVSRSVVDPPTAKVVSLDGSLREYSIPVKVSEILGYDHSCFLCNSDSLYYDAYIPALDPNQSVELNQLYFVLPVDKLERPVSGPDMAALAMKASSALGDTPKSRWGRGTVRVIPMDSLDGYKRFNEVSVGDSRSRSVQKKTVRRTDSLRAGTVNRSFGLRLSAIEELAE